MKGTIMRSTGSWYEILSEEKLLYKGRLRGKFKIKGLKVTNPIAVGDEVIFDLEDVEERTALITDILPRSNYFIRQSVHKSAHGHLIASNLDQILMIVTLKEPRTSLGFIDRLLVSAEAFRIPSVLIFNKTDLYEEQTFQLLNELCTTYGRLNYGSINTSVVQNTGLEEVKKILTGKRSLLSGHSGAGKSSLINVLIPGLQLRTAEISDFANKGVHTTTFAEMFIMEGNTQLIDTPGIKELGLFEIDKEELSHYFPEMRQLLGSCKFNNCLHVNEPKCAVIENVKSGNIAVSRYQSYLSMLENEDSHH
jgi:ribosome biogenesis GTPase